MFYLEQDIKVFTRLQLCGFLLVCLDLSGWSPS